MKEEKKSQASICFLWIQLFYFFSSVKKKKVLNNNEIERLQMSG
jgi:hypothetical protein